MRTPRIFPIARPERPSSQSWTISGSKTDFGGGAPRGGHRSCTMLAWSAVVGLRVVGRCRVGVMVPGGRGGKGFSARAGPLARLDQVFVAGKHAILLERWTGNDTYSTIIHIYGLMSSTRHGFLFAMYAFFQPRVGGSGEPSRTSPTGYPPSRSAIHTDLLPRICIAFSQVPGRTVFTAWNLDALWGSKRPLLVRLTLSLHYSA